MIDFCYTNMTRGNDPVACLGYGLRHGLHLVTWWTWAFWIIFSVSIISLIIYGVVKVKEQDIQSGGK
jgi:TM2 domain-containing membrane protein YozV